MGTAVDMLLPVVVLIATVLGATAGGSIVSDVGVYWGQNSEEGSLAEACDTGLYKTVAIGFLTGFGGGRNASLNLSGHCDVGSHNGNCSFLGEQISSCQSKGVKVLLSIGGDEDDYFLSDTDDAESLSTYIWKNFLGGSPDEGSTRPLGDAVLDGVDFYIHSRLSHPPVHYDRLAMELANYNYFGFSEKKVYLAASPDCVPDYHLSEALRTELFDDIFVRFYNSPMCMYSQQLLTRWNAWTGEYPKSHIYMGLSASPWALSDFFVDYIDDVVLPKIRESDNYGGVMLWNRYYDKQTNYSSHLINEHAHAASE